MSFLALFVSLPTKASTGRMRVWRSVKAQGCATLRDGVYLLPDSADSAATLGEVAAQGGGSRGSGQVYRTVGCDEAAEGRAYVALVRPGRGVRQHRPRKIKARRA